MHDKDQIISTDLTLDNINLFSKVLLTSFAAQLRKREKFSLHTNWTNIIMPVSGSGPLCFKYHDQAAYS